jgi:hypothetical protein
MEQLNIGCSPTKSPRKNLHQGKYKGLKIPTVSGKLATLGNLGDKENTTTLGNPGDNKNVTTLGR